MSGDNEKNVLPIYKKILVLILKMKTIHFLYFSLGGRGKLQNSYLKIIIKKKILLISNKLYIQNLCLNE